MKKQETELLLLSQKIDLLLNILLKNNPEQSALANSVSEANSMLSEQPIFSEIRQKIKSKVEEWEKQEEVSIKKDKKRLEKFENFNISNASSFTLEDKVDNMKYEQWSDED
ncbi:hypothetical protein ACWXVT_02160 [Mycoplasma sp. 1573]